MSSSNVRTLAAILALASVVDAQNLYLRKNGPRKLHRAITHVGKGDNKKGLEEDVAFWTTLVRKTQEMSLPPDVVPMPTNPPVGPPPGTSPPVVVDPTDPPVGVSDPPVGIFPLTPTSPPVGSPTLPPVPVDGGMPTFPPVGTTTYPPTLPPVPVSGGTPTFPPIGTSTYPPTLPPVPVNGGMPTFPPVGSETYPPTLPPVPVNGGMPTFPPVGSETYPPTLPPIPGVTPTYPPTGGLATAPPAPVAGTFKCPDAAFVGCTAPDPADPQDECPVVGEPCPDGTQGEFCCLDACPRNYCTAKQAPMSVSDSITFILPIQNEVPSP